MAHSDYSLRTHAIRSLITIKRPDVPWQVVVRNVAAVILPLGVGLATGYPDIGLGLGIGALTTMFSDQPGPYRQRLRQLLLASLAAGLASLVGLLIGGQLLPILLATAACGFFGGLLVVFGTDIARVGMTSMILLVITAAEPTSPGAALAGAALIFCGGLLLAALSLAAWPLQRYGPERLALVDMYAGLAELARQSNAHDTDAPALSEVMGTLQQTLLGRHRANGRAMEAFGVLLELAERIRLELTAMNELRGDPAVHELFRDAAAGVLDAIADALAGGDSPEHARGLLQALRSSEHTLLDNHPADALAAHIHALAGQLAAAVRNADWAGSRGELRASAEDTELPPALRSSSIRATLQANLTPRSVAFRHAVRMAICLSLALWIGRALQLPHGYWLPMTAAIVLRPDFAATFNFGLLRVLGTVLGLVLTTVLLYVTPNQPIAHLVLMTALCMSFRYLATAHYGIAVAALTGTVVILLSFEGVSPGAAVAARVINTALGCGMALLAYVAWPTWERTRARDALAEMLHAYASYLEALAKPAQDHTRRDTRSAARTARTNAQASIERMRSEPATPAALLALAQTLFANGNRLARTAMTLEASLDDLARLPSPEPWQRFVESAGEALRMIAAALRSRQPANGLPDLRMQQRVLAGLLQHADDTAAAEMMVRISDRLVDNIDTLAHVLKRDREVASQVQAG
ncbi:MAG TPA: FUSC family protein [Rhodanobacter sp.]|nr:FUSC family protein [Rhodanobacter sp.]